MRNFGIIYCLGLLLGSSVALAELNPLTISDMSAQDLQNKIKTEGLEVNKPYASNMTLLMAVCEGGNNHATIDILLNAGADISMKNNDGTTALMYAAANKFGDDYCFRQLLVRGVDVNEKNIEDVTPLMFAATNQSDPKFVVALLSAGADINARDKNGETVLFYAARSNSSADVMSELLKNGADIHKRGNLDTTVLEIAAGYNPNPTVIKLLLDHGADINAADLDNVTPLMNAVKSNPNPEVARYILARGANPNLVSRYGRKALDFADFNQNFRNSDVYELLETVSN